MRIVLILTDGAPECKKALDMLARYEELFSAEVSVFVVLEDLYRLEKASVSLGVPLPPDTVKNAKERVRNKVTHTWKHVKGSEEAKIIIESVAGDLQEEVPKFVKDKKPDMVLWGCQPTPLMCRIIDELDIPSVIIK
ncbi:nucleotide-binding universal stress UspA family protein [Hydrogenivirga caldilitoris]|uniref:Nucleotide-binding universal stress UspA family protein n=1 Tax=Hydrogenivirga caldilitoris TaxID=246264 RepID=A0A497XMK1_9AQUI|nr:universal stress protein [Hydrogenivirga caldilitoris]RLJ70058.1 nucleotide-binding universal stress UspA family protein [Hydrogenivirga caldilitoris]